MLDKVIDDNNGPRGNATVRDFTRRDELISTRLPLVRAVAGWWDLSLPTLSDGGCCLPPAGS